MLLHCVDAETVNHKWLEHNKNLPGPADKHLIRNTDTPLTAVV